MKAFALREEDLRAFYPLLPEEIRKSVPSDDMMLLGAAETDPAGEDHACGAMVLQLVSDEILLLKWLLVAPEYQCRGAGSALLALACDVAAELEVQLLCVFSESPKDGEGGAMYRFFGKHGFSVRAQESKTYSIPVGKLEDEEFFRREVKNDAAILTLEETPAKLIAELNHTLAEQGQLLDGPISRENALSDVSLTYVEDGTVTACVIFRQLTEKAVELSFACSGKKSSFQMPVLLLRAQYLLSRKFAPETELVIPCVTDASRRLVETLAPSAAVSHVAYSAYWKPETAAN